MLERFRRIKLEEIKDLKRMKRLGSFPAPFCGTRPGLKPRLKGGAPAIIAEIKKASPSHGEIKTDQDTGELAAIYAQNGAEAISVLTEEHLFHGHVQDLNLAAPPGLPLLRKDFILDPVQMEHTASTPASAVLLIVRFIGEQSKLCDLIGIGQELGLEVVTEVFSAQELDCARRAGADIVQVNNRNLDNLEVDLDNSRSLVKEKKDQEIWISASGLDTRKQCLEMHYLGFDACLIGTSVMLASDPGEKLNELTGVRR
ncbi:MAG: indole-3-glycerol phosphate synthase TrpC [Desulfonatronovibrionaceae bacterium]